ncbi:MAG TPA: hypothetical protein VH500_14735 [Nitrososphaeraceae archaeon]|jgi:hypothetical protein
MSQFEISMIIVVTMVTTITIIQPVPVVNATTSLGRVCDDNINCITNDGKTVELSNAKWTCIRNALQGAFEKAISISNPKLWAVITEITLGVCLTSIK